MVKLLHSSMLPVVFLFHFEPSLERCGKTDFSQHTDLSAQCVVVPPNSLFPNKGVLQQKGKDKNKQ